MNTSAIFGFINTLEDVLRRETLTHIAFGFDPPGPTFHHEAYEAYKAQREETPEDIRIAIPYIREIIAAYCHRAQIIDAIDELRVKARFTRDLGTALALAG